MTYFVENLLNDLTLIWLLASGEFLFKNCVAIDCHTKLLICFLIQNQILLVLLCVSLQSIYLIPFPFHFLILRFSFLFLFVLIFGCISLLIVRTPRPPFTKGGIDFLKFGNKGGDEIFFNILKHKIRATFLLVGTNMHILNLNIG